MNEKQKQQTFDACGEIFKYGTSGKKGEEIVDEPEPEPVSTKKDTLAALRAKYSK